MKRFGRLFGLALGLCWTLAVCLGGSRVASAADPPRVKILFLGDNGHHQPALRFKQLAPVFAERGIDLTYTDRTDSLNPRTLGEFSGLMIYANLTEINPDEERALLEYVRGGRGLIPLHCASFCFLNSPAYIALVGGQFRSHGTGTFRTEIAQPNHPIMKGYRGFESWDETYVHHKHNDQGRTVLEFRVDDQGREPWTWVRDEGKGRVFYTAWGHDDRTWGNAGFHNLVERGTRWAIGQDPATVPTFADRPEMTSIAANAAKFEYLDAVIPFYPPSKKWGTIDEPLKKMQAPLKPTDSLQHIVTPVGFQVKLFVSEPQLQGKPIAINWDERGRLWVCESFDYPNEMQPEGEGRDRIRICEDTDGDGQADKFTVFADKLSIPTSLTFAYGGVIVHQAPHTLFLKDTTGDDVADVRQVLFTGWSTGDTHAGPSNLRYGLDNWYYGMVGYAGFSGEIAGEKQRFQTGFYRFHLRAPAAGKAYPEVDKFEFLRNTSNNSWGVGFSEEGVLFGSTANGNPSVYLPLPNRYYESVRGWSSSVLGTIAESNKIEPLTEKVRQVDHHGGFTAAAGHALYTARSYPQEYWNRTAFVTEPTGHLAATFTIQKQGANYRSKNSWNLFASDDEWSAPIIVEVGPDGSAWVVDWYNFIVQHNPTPAGFKTGKGNAYEINLRDKKHGRVYRVVHADGKPSPAAALAGATAAQQVAALDNPNMLWRLHAQRLLIEKADKQVVPSLLARLAKSQPDAIGLDVGAIHAVAVLNGLQAAEEEASPAQKAVIDALRHPSAGVRRNAVAALPSKSAAAALLAANLLQDADGQVRLATLLKLSESPANQEVAQKLVAFLAAGGASDNWLLDAATTAAAAHDRYFLIAAAKAGEAVAARPETLARITIVAEHFARGKPVDAVGDVVVALANADQRATSAILAGLERGWPKDAPGNLNESTEKALLGLLEKLPAGSRAQLVNLATRWGSKKLETYAAEIAKSFLTIVRDDKAADDARSTAARQLIEFRPKDESAIRDLLAVFGPRTSPELGKGLCEALALSEAAAAGGLIVEKFGAMTPASRPTAVRVLLSRPEWSAAMIDAVEKATLPLGDLTLDQKQALAAHPDKKLAERAKKLLEKGGGLPNPDRQKVVDELMPITKRTGNAGHGKDVYKKQCAKCHVHSGEGNKIGPELTGMAVHPKHELLVHILDPSRSVEGNFRVYSVVTEDGRVMQGLLASESKTAIEIFDAEGKKHALQRNEIEQLVASPKSLMPEGFEKQVTADDLCDLLEFLTQRGKFVPIPLDKYATAVSTKGLFFSEQSEVERMIFADWGPKTFEGVPFSLVDPQGQQVPNIILLHGPNGNLPPKMPKTVTLPCNAPARAIHLLSGVSGWGHPASGVGSVSMIVRLHYADGQKEDHELKNGEHFADYIRRVDVPGSKFAFALRGQQLRYLAVLPKRADVIEKIELVKGPDGSSPIVMAVTVESR
ncbi:MAG: PVC-type heme-binding CxxCH protein [Planctomycetota bacterium]